MTAREQFDLIVVGARCAGAALATFSAGFWGLAFSSSTGTGCLLIRSCRPTRFTRLVSTYWTNWEWRDEGSLEGPSELESRVLRHVGKDRSLRDLMTRVPEHQASPYDALPIRVVLTPLAGALIRGRLGVIPEFLAQARKLSRYKSELNVRRRLLEEAEKITVSQ